MRWCPEIISLNDKRITKGEGRMDLGIELGQVEVTPVGKIVHNTNNDSTNLNVFLGINFFMNSESMRIMAEKLYNVFPPLEAVIYGNDFEKALMELAGKEKTTKYMQELNLYGASKKTPEEISQTMFLSDVKLVWNTKTSSYRYKGFIGVSTITGFQVNKQCFGYIEFTKKRGGDIFSIYLEPSEGQWYYFSYRNGVMNALSSNLEFNVAIRDTKPEKRVSKGKDNYEYTQGTEMSKRNFLRGFGEK